jgi:hypothetical protein
MNRRDLIRGAVAAAIVPALPAMEMPLCEAALDQALAEMTAYGRGTLRIVPNGIMIRAEFVSILQQQMNRIFEAEYADLEPPVTP